MSRDLPPGFVEFTNELAQTQTKERDTADTGCLGGFFVGMAVFLVTAFLAFPAGALLRQVVFDVGSTSTAEAEALRVGNGSLEVRFTTEDGELVYAWLPHDPRTDDSRTLEVTYRVNHPQEALTVDHPRTFAGPVFIVLVVAWVLFELFHRRGLRAGWFWRRARTLAKGPLTREEETKRQMRTAGQSASARATLRTDQPIPGAWDSAVVGSALVLGGLGMLGVGLFRAPEIWAGIALVSLGFGVCLLRAAAYRYADTVPVTDPPRPFRLLPRGSFRWVSPVLLAAAVVITVPALSIGNDAGAPPASRGEAHGWARIVDDGCNRNRSGAACQAYVVLEYRADGTGYRERVVVDLLGLDDLVARERVAVAWDVDDPRQVRLVSP